ncbi:MAG: GNAT family N-acetyltransferase [Saprospiraceae bacterium]|nr:GNAT family N-acetyltransferase [Saprospiraceae bacterium]
MHGILETNRLLLRKFTIDDAPFMLRLVNEPTWIQYIGDRNVRSLEDAQKYIRDGSIQSYRDHGFGFYNVCLRDTQMPIGSVGFAKRPFLEHPDFGFAFLPEYTGQGYAIEMAVAAMAYAEEVLKLEKLVAITLPSNKRSIQLLIKLGFRFEKTVMVEKEELFLFGAELTFVHKDEED